MKGFKELLRAHASKIHTLNAGRTVPYERFEYLHKFPELKHLTVAIDNPFLFEPLSTFCETIIHKSFLSVRLMITGEV